MNTKLNEKDKSIQTLINMIITINWYKGTFTIHMKYGNKSINFSGPKYHTAEFGVSLKEVKLPSTKVCRTVVEVFSGAFFENSKVKDQH